MAERIARVRSAVAEARRGVLAGAADAGAAAARRRGDPPARHRRPRHDRAAHAEGFRRRADRRARPSARRAQRQFLRPGQRHDGRRRRSRSRLAHPADRRWRTDPGRAGIDDRQGRGRLAAAAAPGGIAAEDIEALLGRPLLRGGAAGVEAPGMLASHYAPGAAVRLDAREVRPGEALLAFGPSAIDGADKAVAVLNLSPSGRSARSRGQSLLDDPGARPQRRGNHRRRADPRCRARRGHQRPAAPRRRTA